MSTKRINGSQLEQMLRNGLANLKTQESEINRLNVFPVSDGDTGTNMRLTLEHGIQYAYSTAAAGDYLKKLSEGMLLGARGNSGVILSQFFKGFYVELARCAQLGVGELRNGLIRGYRTAYSLALLPQLLHPYWVLVLSNLTSSPITPTLMGVEYQSFPFL